MKIWNLLAFFCLLLFVLVGCGTNVSASSTNVSVDIQADGFSKTINKPDLVQQLYDKARALPQAEPTRICPTIARSKYTLTFIKNGKILLSGIADDSGCGSFTINKNNIRQTDDTFWLLIHQALAS